VLDGHSTGAKQIGRLRPRRRWFPRSMLAGMDGVGHVGQPDVDFRDQPPRDLAIARLAEGQHTVVSLTQLNAGPIGRVEPIRLS
jgi:hypothetical protein